MDTNSNFLTTEEFRAIQARRGWTNRQAAEALGVSERFIEMLCQGSRTARGPLVVALRLLEERAGTS